MFIKVYDEHKNVVIYENALNVRVNNEPVDPEYQIDPFNRLPYSVRKFITFNDHSRDGRFVEIPLAEFDTAYITSEQGITIERV